MGIPGDGVTFQSRETCVDCLCPVPFAVYHAIYLEELTAVELTEKIAQLFSISPRQISQIYKQGPTGIHVLISDEVDFSAAERPRGGLSGRVTGARAVLLGRRLCLPDRGFSNVFAYFPKEFFKKPCIPLHIFRLT